MKVFLKTSYSTPLYTHSVLSSVLFLHILPCRSLFHTVHVAALNVPRRVLFTLTYTCIRLWSCFLSATARSSSKVLSCCSRCLFIQQTAENWDTSPVNVAERLAPECSSRKEEKFTLCSLARMLLTSSWGHILVHTCEAVCHHGKSLQIWFGISCSRGHYWSLCFVVFFCWRDYKEWCGVEGHVDVRDKAECVFLES